MSEPVVIPAEFGNGVTIADMLASFEVEDDKQRLGRLRSEVAPGLRYALRAYVPRIREVYGDDWRELVTEAVRPAPRDTSTSRHAFHYSDAGYCARRIRTRPYRVHANDGKRAMILEVRLAFRASTNCFGTALTTYRREEVGLFEELWRAHRDVCLALSDAAGLIAWGDVILPGPPFVPFGTHLDHLLHSRTERLELATRPDGVESGTADAIRRARWGFLCLFPVFVSLVELGLSRQPSLRPMHDRLCRYLASSIQTDEGVEEPMSSRLRYRVIERDGFRCVMCGATAAVGAVLQVDHILPVSRGGKTTIGNLQTLCDRCNRGKGASLSPDLRA